MTEANQPFIQSPNSLDLTIRYLEAYLRRFGNKFADKIKFKSVQQALALAKA